MSWFFVGDHDFDLALTAALWVVGFSALGCYFVIPAYGRFASKSMGVSFDGRVGWWLMELPATLSFVYFFFVVGGPQSSNFVPRLCATLWCVHYFNRGWMFPLLTRVAKGQANKTFSISVIGVGVIFTTLHGYINARWFAEHGTHLTSDWLRHPQFILGFIIYETGFILTLHSEHVIRNLRDSSSTSGPRYKIPRGGLYQFVTNGSYFAELVAWFGFAVFTNGPGGVIIFVISCINLIPRAFETHKWYLAKFPEEYLRLKRKILIPGML
eukprot:c11907_g1_i1.p1 GENE.c11907_g1_i1~~c11907_g1_i1.p1  ORF type:complete len:269 (-),score=39.34 c11907_g1_i1:448-1254(-)